MTPEVLVAIIFGVLTIILTIIGIWATLQYRSYRYGPQPYPSTATTSEGSKQKLVLRSWATFSAELLVMEKHSRFDSLLLLCHDTSADLAGANAV